MKKTRFARSEHFSYMIFLHVQRFKGINVALIDQVPQNIILAPTSGLLLAQGRVFAYTDGEHRAQLRSILDVGCGPGGWALDVAFTQPESEVAGVDISKTTVAYANARARSQDLINASFGVMDNSSNPFIWVWCNITVMVMLRHRGRITAFWKREE